MSYQELIARTWKYNVLYSVHLELTYSCDLNCYYCYNDRKLQGTPLSLEQYFSFFADLRRMNVMQLVLSGGEPLMHPDFFQIGARAKELGFLIRLKTNGNKLDAATIQRIQKEISPFCIDLSLHGASAAVHDRQTQIPGSLQRLLNNLQALKESGQRFRINTTMTRWNEEELEQMMTLVETLGSTLNISFQVSPQDDGNQNPLSIKVSKESESRAAGIIAEHSQQVQEQPVDCEPAKLAGKLCGIGSSTVTVDPYGNVLPCVQWRESTDSLHERRIQDIWEDSRSLKKTRAIARELFLRGEANSRSDLKQGFCLALARSLGHDELLGTRSNIPIVRRGELL